MRGRSIRVRSGARDGFTAEQRRIVPDTAPRDSLRKAWLACRDRTRRADGVCGVWSCAGSSCLRGLPAALVLLCFAKPFLACHDRAGRAGGESSPGSARPYSPGEDSPPSRLQCRGGWRLRTVMRSRRRASHTVTRRERFALEASVACLFTLRGVHIRQQHPHISSWHLKANARCAHSL